MRANALTRISTVGPIAEMIEASGGSVSRVFQRAELPLSLLAEPDRFILLRDQFRLLEVAARELGDHALAFKLSSAAGMAGLGPYGDHLMSFRRLGPAITTGYRRMRHLLQAATDMQLHIVGKNAYWSYQITDRLDEGRQKNEFLALGYMLGILRVYAGADWSPEWVEISGRLEARSELEQTLRSGIASGGRAMVVFPAEFLELENPYRAPAAAPKHPVPDPSDLPQIVSHLIMTPG